MRNLAVKDIIKEDAVLIGRKTYGEAKDGEEIYEELYITEDGTYLLIGNQGVNDRFLEGGEFDAWCLPDREGILRMTLEEAQYWAARFLTHEEYERAFGRCSRMEKILINIKPNDLYELFSDARECRAQGLTKKEFAESTGLNAKKTYPGFTDIGMYELADRMWDLCNPDSAYPEGAEQQKESETVQV